MARLDSTVALVKDGAPEELFAAYRRECGQVMGTVFYDVINYARKCLPPLSEDDFYAEWRAVATERRARDSAPVGSTARESVEHELDVVAARITTLGSSFVAEWFRFSDEALTKLRALVSGWRS